MFISMINPVVKVDSHLYVNYGKVVALMRCLMRWLMRLKSLTYTLFDLRVMNITVIQLLH